CSLLLILFPIVIFILTLLTWNLSPLHLTMIIAMAAMRVVQMAVHQVIGVIAVRHSFVAAAGAMLVGLVMAAAVMLGSALARVLLADRQLVLFHIFPLDVVQVAVVQVIDVVVMLDGGVAAAGAMLMVVVGVAGTGRHGILFPSW